jgi:prevent-host-death family protein
MSTYSVAAAKAGLPRLINQALAGEEVVITRHGKPVVELKSAAAPAPTAKASAAALERLLAHRVKLPKGAPNSVELLRLIYDEPDV